MSGGFVGVDWGSSRLRAYLFGAHGSLIDQRSVDIPLVTLNRADFARNLEACLVPWAGRFADVILSGMVTSRKGWIETSYLDCPADLSALAAHVRWHRHRDWSLAFLPGLSCRRGGHDVIRGEELQLYGLGDVVANGFAILPGTHSKWVRLESGRVMQFRTIITGELYALLRDGSLIGQLATDPAEVGAAFLAAVHRGFASSTPLADLFTLRARCLLGDLTAADVASALSGHLIGGELREAQAAFGTSDAPIWLLGGNAAADFYAAAMDALGITVQRAPNDLAQRGFARIAGHVFSGQAATGSKEPKVS